IPNGYQTMLAIHNQFTHQSCDRLTTTCLGLGLVRLLQDAKRFDEARATLYSLEEGFQGVPVESDEPSRKPCKKKGVIKSASCSPTRAAPERRPQALSLA